MMFEGYCAGTVDFLWGIRMNNNRDWFAAHKNDYQQYLYNPTKALGMDIAAALEGRVGDLCKVSRIYRDARLHHPDPYKESLWICVRKDVLWWAENPCLFFEINPEGVSYGLILWQPRTETLKHFRQVIAADEADFLKLITKTEKDTGIAVTAGKTYKRPPQIAPRQTLEPFYAWKGDIRCIAHEDFSPETFGPALGERVTGFLKKLLPLYDYLCLNAPDFR